MESLKALVETLNHYIWSFGIPVGSETIPWVVIALLGTGVFLTLRLGFIQFRRLGHGAAVATGRYDDPDDPGDVSHFQALSTALSATVGIGNIGGVAIAIHWGGPGALFWMWITALVGMATKFAEVTLAQRYRSVEKEEGGNSVAGGPMYYIERGLGPAWRPLALFFAIMLGLTAFLTGDGVQANTVADTMEAVFSVDPMITGAITAAIVAAVILGGIRRIGKVTAVLAPAMALLYVGAALIIIVMNAGEILPTLGLIVREAFEPTAGVAGTGVGAILVTMMWGVKRGLFSNEAGQGSAPIAHAAARTDEPVSEGVVALLEPFIDTIIICTMTALVIVMTGVWSEKISTEVTLDGGDISYVMAGDNGGWQEQEEPGPILVQDGVVTVADGPQAAWHDVPVERLYTDEAKTQPFTGVIDPAGKHATARDGTEHKSLWGDAVESGAPLTMLGFRRGLSSLGDFGHYVVLLCVLLFGVSTAISWSYYGDRCAHYVWGPKAVLPYRVVYVGMHFFGAVAPLKLAWELGDVAMGMVIVPNLIALVLLAPKVVEMTRDYFQRQPWRRS